MKFTFSHSVVKSVSAAFLAVDRHSDKLTLVGSAAATVHRLRTDHRTWKVLEEELGAGEPSKSTCTGKWDYISHSLARPSKQTFNGSHRINLVSLCLTKSNPV